MKETEQHSGLAIAGILNKEQIQILIIAEGNKSC